VPVILLMLGSFVLQSVALPKIDVDQAVKDQMQIVDKMTKGNLPAEKRRRSRRTPARGSRRARARCAARSTR
jgi:hypothetical protein